MIFFIDQIYTLSVPDRTRYYLNTTATVSHSYRHCFFVTTCFPATSTYWFCSCAFHSR